MDDLIIGNVVICIVVITAFTMLVLPFHLHCARDITFVGGLLGVAVGAAASPASFLVFSGYSTHRT